MKSSLVLRRSDGSTVWTCACGCDVLVHIFDQNPRERVWVKNHSPIGQEYNSFRAWDPDKPTWPEIERKFMPPASEVPVIEDEEELDSLIDKFFPTEFDNLARRRW